MIVNLISFELHDEPMFPLILELAYIMGIVILSLCWLNYDSDMLNGLYLMSIMYIYGEIFMSDPCGSRFEGLNKISL